MGSLETDYYIVLKNCCVKLHGRDMKSCVAEIRVSIQQCAHFPAFTNA